MKGNNGSGNNCEHDLWRTPSWLYDTLDIQYCFTFDCCASPENAKCRHYSQDFESVKNSPGTAWMNPPFSKAKAMFAHWAKVIDEGVAIYRCDNLETAIWQDLIFPHSDWILFLDGRLNYDSPDDSPSTGCRFPSALIGVGLDSPSWIKGTVIRTNKKP